MNSFRDGLNAVLIGASGGIGGAMLELLAGHPRVAGVLACSRSPSIAPSPKVRPVAIDLENETSIAAAADVAASGGNVVDLVLVAAGILHEGADLRPEKSWRALDPVALERAYRINAIGPALVAKHFLPLLNRDEKSVLAALSARVGSISDNHLGGWYAYRASKAALNMLIRTLSIELGRRNRRAACVGLHPGTVESSLSGPFQANVPEGKLFSPPYAAARLLEVLDRIDASDSGNVFAWDGQRIPP